MTIITPSFTFTRPNDTTPYADGDMVANSTVAGEVVPMTFSVAALGSGRGSFRRLRMWKSTAAVDVAGFSIFVFSEPPEILSGDNEPLLIGSAKHFIGGDDVNLQSQAFVAQNDVARSVSVQWSPFDLVNGRLLYAVLRADAAYVPGASEQFEITLDVEG